MYKHLKAGMIDWKKKTGERQKLQHVYLLSAVIVLLAAGVISLLNDELGQTVAQFALAATVAFVINGIVWKLLVETILSYIEDK